jgi:hypothetical protein
VRIKDGLNFFFFFPADDFRIIKKTFSHMVGGHSWKDEGEYLSFSNPY